jgi:uncharacterized protein YecE (DUF72 family)
MSNLRIGTAGWNYPSGRGTWNGVFYPAGRARRKGFDELAYYAEHFDTVEVNSTFYGQPRAEVTRGWVARTPARFEFSVKLYQKFTHPRMFEGARRTRCALRRDGAQDRSKRWRGRRGRSRRVHARHRSARDIGQARASARAVSRQLQATAQPARLLSPCSMSSRLSVAVELRHSSWSDAFGETLTLLNASARLGADRRAEVPLFNPPELPAERQGLLLHAAARPERREMVAARQVGGSGTTICTRDELKEFTETAAGARELVKKAYLYTQQSLLREVGRQRRD